MEKNDNAAGSSEMVPKASGESGAAESSSEVLNAKGFEPSRQWVIWAIMFGVLLLALLLTF